MVLKACRSPSQRCQPGRSIRPVASSERDIEADQLRIRIASPPALQTAPGYSQIKNSLGFKRDEIESLLHPAIDFPSEKIGLAAVLRASASVD